MANVNCLKTRLINWKNMSAKSPLYYVYCCMCPGSFAAAGDNLSNLIDQALSHAQNASMAVKRYHGNVTVTSRADVIRSDMFEWEFKRISPLSRFPVAESDYNTATSGQGFKPTQSRPREEEIAPPQ